MAIEVNALTKIYGTQKAVDNISFSVHPGEIVGFLGPNGAGKSTTMKMITGYISADVGTARVCGIDVSADPIAVKKRMGYLPEANPLYYDMYVKEYLYFVAGVYKIKFVQEKIKQAIELTGLSAEQHKKIAQLSKGYKQRTGLAAALVHNPEVLILDEPTSGLDPNQIIEIRNVIKEQGKNKTVLFSSHILQEVQAICERVIIINKGQIVADDKLSNMQQHEKGNAVKVSFREIINKEMLATLQNVMSVAAENDYTWKLFTNDAPQVKKQLLVFALEKNLNIVSLETQGNQLEDIFRAFTTK